MSTIDDFFRHVSAHRQPLLATTTGTLRFELREDGIVETWVVNVAKGDVDATRDPGADVDTTIRVEKALFADIVTGRANAISAVLRGDLGVEGDVELVLIFQRVFPGPHEARLR
ncbi:MAG: SCP2 sterol-binding domain-containing protein [Acidimicrobiia bacterium]